MLLPPFLLGCRLPFSATWWEVPQRGKENWEVCLELTIGFWAYVLWLAARTVFGALRYHAPLPSPRSLMRPQTHTFIQSQSSVVSLGAWPWALCQGPGHSPAGSVTWYLGDPGWPPCQEGLCHRVCTDETLLPLLGGGYPTAPFLGPLERLAQLSGMWSFLNDVVVQIIRVGKLNTTDDNNSACSVRTSTSTRSGGGIRPSPQGGGEVLLIEHWGQCPS